MEDENYFIVCPCCGIKIFGVGDDLDEQEQDAQEKLEIHLDLDSCS